MTKTSLRLLGGMMLSLMTMSAFGAEKVAIGVPSWTGAQAIAHLLKVVVEERIGGQAELVPGRRTLCPSKQDRAAGLRCVQPV